MTTIPGLLMDMAPARATAPAISDGGWQLSYGELRDKVLVAAGAMRAKGLGQGDRFAIWAPNCAEWIIMALAGQALGGILVTLNTRYKGAEAADIIKRSGAKLLFTVDGFLGLDFGAMLEGEDLGALRETIVLRSAEGTRQTFDDFPGGAPAPLDDGDVALIPDQAISDIIYTSGTTGRAKGVMTSHGQNVAVFAEFIKAIGLRADDRYLVVNPFFHSFGYKAGWLSCLIAGAAVYPAATVDPLEIMRRIEAERITVMPGAPPIFATLLDHPARARFDLSSLRLATTGATMIPVDLIRRMREELGIDHVYSAYGLTESSGVVSLCQRGDDARTIATTCGRALPNTEVAVMAGGGGLCQPGEEGEVWVRGFNVMQGYFDDPVATRDTITPDGWLKTGDIGVLNAAGYLKITDRKKDMIIVGGFNCYPAEVERQLLTHPGIRDAAVTKMKDTRLGEVPQAFIVTDDADLSEDRIIDWARASMANFKVPRKVTVLPALPRNASGKVMKFLLARGDF